MSDQFAPGDIIGERYQVISLLGRGGMGLVYRVKQIFLNKEMALKTLDRSRMSDATMRRFQQEAQTIFALNHPNIVAVNDFGLLPDQTPYFAMELIRGTSLADHIATKGPLSIDDAIACFVQISFALAHAHECGIIHRDIKPSNIMFVQGMPRGAEGSIRIIDFGIAKLTSREGGEIQQLTRTGEVFGSPLYMSPEQCTGLQLDYRADIYSLGCVFFETLTGSAPFVTETALATMLAHQSQKPPSLKEATLGGTFPPSLEKIVTTLLEKKPEQRYQNLGLLAHDLAAVKRGESVFIPRSEKSAVPPKSKSITLNPMQLVLTVLAIGLISATVGFLLRELLSPPITATKPEHISAFDSDTKRSGQEDDETLDLNYTINETFLRKRLNEAKQTSTEFGLSGRTISAALMKVIAQESWIQTLALGSCAFTNSSLGALTALPALKEIRINNSNLDNEGASEISKIKTLRAIYANDTLISDTGIENFFMMPNLEKLYIENTGMTSEGLSKAAKAANLQCLNLRRMSKIDDLSPLANSHINELEIGGKKIHDKQLLQLSAMRSLKKLMIDSAPISGASIEKLLESRPDLTQIVVTKCPDFTPADKAQLQRKFPKTFFM